MVTDVYSGFYKPQSDNESVTAVTWKEIIYLFPPERNDQIKC